jgi:hypothetical protein
MGLLATPATPTTTLPDVAPPGTGTTMLVADQLVGVAAVPLNVTVLAPLVDPKFDPAIVTDVPIDPLAGVRFVIEGGGTDGAATEEAARNATSCMTQLPPETEAVAL